ncbi:MAG: hypothetical protein QOJ32_3424 [Frankiaceae bacterium]|nr:hypothetical protein [Frankiaceae bacterium]
MTGIAAPRTRFSTPGDTDIVVVREFAAPRGKVWAAYTRPEHLQQWLSTPDWPMDLCEVDLRVGGTYRYRWRKRRLTGEPVESFSFSGQFLEVDAPSRLVSTETYEPAASTTVDAPRTVVTLILDEADGRTTLTLVLRYPSREVRDAVFAGGMARGLDTNLTQLEDLLASG